MQGDQDIAEIGGGVLALDVGGSSVKSGLVCGDGRLVEMPTVAVDASGPMSGILETLGDVFLRGVEAMSRPPVGIGIAFPGPFDYARGVSLMKHKYAALKDVPLAEVLRSVCPVVGGVPIRFMHDAHAFLAGERWLGAARGTRCCLGVTLGTGIGIACWKDGAFVANELGSPSPEVSVWNRPYRGGRVEDWISTRGLVDRYRGACPGYQAELGVRGIAEAANRGDAVAERVFRELGENLGAVLAPLCQRFVPERIVFGGQISNGFALFSPSLRAGLAGEGREPVIVRGKLGAAAALNGVASLFFAGNTCGRDKGASR